MPVTGVKPQNPVVNRSHPLARGLVGAWAFQDGGGSVLRDISGNGHDGTIVNSPAWVSTAHGGGLQFVKASTTYVTFPTDIFDLGSDGSAWLTKIFTVSLWIRPDFPGPSTGGIIDYIWSAGTNTNNGQNISYEHRTIGGVDDTFAVGTWSSGPYYIHAPDNYPFEQGEWLLLTLSMDYEAGVYSLYLNGSLAGSYTDTTGSIVVPGRIYDPVELSASHANGFDGQVSDVRFWSRVLQPNEVRDLWVDRWALYRPARPVRELYRGAVLRDSVGITSSSFQPIESGAIFGAPGIASTLHSIDTGIAT